MGLAKLEEIAVLRGLLQTGDEETDQRIEKAIEHIEKSVASELWETDSTLTMEGKKVFDEEKDAVKELMKIVEDGDPADTHVDLVISVLVAVDAELADVAIEQAIEQAEAAGCDEESGDSDCQKALEEIAKAQEERGKAQVELKPDEAIEHYKKAWEHAQEAMGKVPEPDE